MPSDMERALDEILSGVNALMQQAPKAVSAPVSGMQRPAASLDQPGTTSLTSDQFASTLALLAIVESDLASPVSSVASRLITQLLLARCVRVDNISSDFDGVTVSPLIYPVFQTLSGLGARWVDCDADSLLWQMSGVNVAQAHASLKKFSSVICPEQTRDGLCWRLPRIPERSPLNWISADDVSSSPQLIRAEQVAVIDQDKRGKKTSTIIWSGDVRFVPDWWCGSAFHQGQWRPVVHWAAADFTAS